MLHRRPPRHVGADLRQQTQRVVGADAVDLRQVDAGDDRTAAGKTRQVGPGAAADFEHALAAIPVEVDQAQQVVEFLEMILIEIGEERGQVGLRRTAAAESLPGRAKASRELVRAGKPIVLRE